MKRERLALQLRENKNHLGFPRWSSGQCRGHEFDPWSGRFHMLRGQLRLWAAITEPRPFSPSSITREVTVLRSPCTPSEELGSQRLRITKWNNCQHALNSSGTPSISYVSVLWTECFCPPTSQNHMWEPNPQCDSIRKWGLWEVIRMSALINDAPVCSLAPCMWGHRRQMSMKQAAGLYYMSNLPSTWFWTSQSWEMWERNVGQVTQSVVVCYSSPNWFR